VAKSDLTNYLDYLDGLEQFHEQKRVSFYPKIFKDQPVYDENWGQYRLESYKDPRTPNWRSLIPLTLFILIFVVLGQKKWSRLTEQ